MTSGRRSALAFLTGNSLAQAASYASSAMLSTTLLGPHGRGLMVLGVSIASVTPLLAGMGTGSELRARLPNVGNGAARQRLLSSYTWWSVLAVGGAGGLAVLVTAGSAPLIDPGLADPAFLLAVLVVAAGYTALTQFPDAWYAAGLFRTGSAWAAAVASGGLLGMLVGALLERTAWMLLLAQGTGMVAVAVLQATRLRAAGLLPVRGPGRWELSQLLRAGIRALGLTVGLALTLRADRYLLGAVAGAAAVGVYSLAATLSEAPRVIPTALGQLVNRDVALGADLARVQHSRRLALLASTAMSLLVAAGGWWLIVPVFGAEFAEARPLLLVLLVAEIVFAPYAVASRGLLGGGWMGTAGTLGLLGSVAATTIYGLAIPVWGTYGAALASVTVYGGLSWASWALLRHRLDRSPIRTPNTAGVLVAPTGTDGRQPGGRHRWST
ncbi:hypothetical protein GCM10027280_40370 [Micromonospora polyrhachis]|uniref:O-antigen/teichoic acid export membrane protein n=1 Tax=Micromonospora polyrhachis TaxID=1282883 RepID=A0A7W7SL16_9ACTN|nr:hypothetical protein [Micromonospora polyrhachis]MBB4956737.1 O-antigen/teichoic acid export membrane protein [Micromonospora polyrhachis]